MYYDSAIMVIQLKGTIIEIYLDKNITTCQNLQCLHYQKIVSYAAKIEIPHIAKYFMEWVLT